MPSLAHAQATPPSNTTESSATRLPERLSANTRSIIQRLADSLTQARIPSNPLFDKAAEGVLKGAEDERIVAAVRALARELGVAANLLGPSASVSDVISAAGALRADVPLAAVRKIAERGAKSGASDGRLALSFIILADFASRGVPVDATVNAVDGLLARGAGGAELSAFRAGVERDLSAGRDARTTLLNRAEGVLRRPP